MGGRTTPRAGGPPSASRQRIGRDVALARGEALAVLEHQQFFRGVHADVAVGADAPRATRRAPRWQRIGRLLFEHGERFYSFRGLHSFKDKFEPVWDAHYLAAPGGLEPVLVLADVATLIGGGVKGVVAK